MSVTRDSFYACAYKNENTTNFFVLYFGIPHWSSVIKLDLALRWPWKPESLSVPEREVRCYNCPQNYYKKRHTGI